MTERGGTADGDAIGEAGPPGRRRVLLIAIAAAVVAGGGLALLLATRDGSDDVAPTSPSAGGQNTAETSSTTVTPPVTTVAAPATTIAAPVVDDAPPVVPGLPTLPPTLSERWSTTIDGRYPQAAVRIDEVIVFGQSDLPGLRAVDAGSGDVVWTLDLGEEAATITDLVVVDGLVVANSIGETGEVVATAVDTTGTVRWTAARAAAASGAVVRALPGVAGNRLDRLGADGSVARSIDLGSTGTFGEPQFEVRDGALSSWYSFPALERLGGPVVLDTDDDVNATSAATTDHVVALSGGTLRFLDGDGAELAALDIGSAGALVPILGARPGVIVEAHEPPDQGLPKPGDTVRAFRLVDGAISEIWARPGRLVAAIDREGRTFAIVTDLPDEAGSQPANVIDAATGDVLITSGLYEEGGASNGFVFTEFDDPDALQTVAYDLSGRELWRLVLEGQERTEIVDRGVLVGNVDSVAQTVELTFYG